MITSKGLRRKYIEFYKKNGHAEIPSASVIPENDPSVLFTTAGMHPLVPFLLGERHPQGKRLVNSQKCIRTGDIDEVGDKTHHTFFEMLGHWSIGDYFKEEAIKMTYQFFVKEIGLDPNKLSVTVFAGDENAPQDTEAINIWKSVGLTEDRIFLLSRKTNWWEPEGSGGPCGPCTEALYWTGRGKPDKSNPDNSNWVEIGNDVLMQYKKLGPGKYESATQKNIDNGTGLERTLAVINGFDDNYLTDVFLPLIEKIEILSNKKYIFKPGLAGLHEINQCWIDTMRSMRIIADHLRAATFIMGDDLGIGPSNVDQGYVVRKLIRRAIRHGRLIGIKDNFTAQIAEVVINTMSDVYPELLRNEKFIKDNLIAEEDKFIRTLHEGLRVFEREIERLKDKQMNGKTVFDLYQSYGFPLELTRDLAHEKGLIIDEIGFEEEFKKHQDLSRTAAAGKFRGGLADHSEKVTAYHTATHLLNAALRKVLGDHVYQKGSNITEERMRFDFSHDKKMTTEELKQTEDIVNEQIAAGLNINYQELSLSEAKAKGAIGVFADKYGEKVKVYSVGNFSIEICGGPHVKNTKELGHFKIIKEEASSSGVRRIKAILNQ